MPVETETLRAEVETALGAAKNPESMIHGSMITRGRGELGLDPDLAENPTRVVIVSPLKTPPAEAYEQGIGVVTFRTQRLADATDAAGAKIANYLIAVLATREARQKGALEALIVDNHGKVVEGTSSNVFQVIDQKLSTPPENLGILPGITRGRVLELAGQLGIAVEHRVFSIDELCRADEVFGELDVARDPAGCPHRPSRDIGGNQVRHTPPALGVPGHGRLELAGSRPGGRSSAPMPPNSKRNFRMLRTGGGAARGWRQKALVRPFWEASHAVFRKTPSKRVLEASVQTPRVRYEEPRWNTST